MAFNPEKITKQHILNAVAKIETENIELIPSTKFDVIIDGKAYPPKEIMRFAHEAMNGERIWNNSGGEPTNRYLSSSGFDVVRKEDPSISSSEKDLIKLLKDAGEDASKTFFKTAETIVKILSIEEGDLRLTFSFTKSKHLSIIIGQRYCLVLRPYDAYPYHFITTKEKANSNSAKYSSFEGKPIAYYCRSKDYTAYTSSITEIGDAAQAEISRTQKSGFRKHNNADFERAVFDTSYKEQLFEQIFKAHKYWAFHCNPNAWDGITDISENDHGHWIVNKQHEKQIEVGDECLLWLSGSQAGIYLFGRILESPKMLNPDADRLKKYSKNDSQFSKPTSKVKVSYDLKLINTPIHRKDVLDSGILEEGSLEYSFFYNPQGVTSRELTNNTFLKFKSMANDSSESEIVEKFRKYLSSIHKGKGTPDEYIRMMPKIEDWLVTNGICDTGFNIWKDTDLIPTINSSLKNGKSDDWKELNKSSKHWYGSPWNKWTEFNNMADAVDDRQFVLELNFSKNIILYGPPGTGKTYNSIDKAVEIASPASYTESNHKANKAIFDELRYEGQIEFVTFHQNYSYEDFMVGVRPDLDESSTLKFKRSEGIFYRLCKRAEQNYLQSRKNTESLRSFDEVFSHFIAPLENENQEIEVKMSSGKASFWITDINPRNLSFRKQSGGTDHTLSLDTIKELYEGKREFSSGLRHYYMPLLKELWGKGKQVKSTENTKNYVIIIDEINRANISRVFGELITLLEEDKRIGAPNELRITLPNGEKNFGIPPNLFLIGTMNTADKSIALIDIALRRRFEFIGYFPDYTNLEISDDIELLKHINKEIFSRKKSADYLIGHAYFMNSTDTSKALKNKVIPLLMEYFSGKTELVEDIFKNSSWSVQYDIDCFNWKANPKVNADTL